MGRLIGEFYRGLVDQDRSLFTSALVRAAGFYVLNSLSGATVAWLAEQLGVQWRGTLTTHLQERYLSDRRYVRLLHPSYDGRFEAARLDNPDQRITQDAALLCAELSQTAKIIAAAPLSLLYYAFLTYRYVGALGVAVASAFFLVGAALQRPLVGRVAALVVQQERLEGDFRAHHVRVRTKAESIALMRAEAFEQREGVRRLGSVLVNLTSLVARRWALALLTKYLEYAGAIINYVIIAIPVFSGAWSSGAGASSGGEVAMKISQASFVTLSLVYGFTQLLDLASRVTNVAGNLSRVFQLVEEMDTLPPATDALDAGRTAHLDIAGHGPSSAPLSARSRPIHRALPAVITSLVGGIGGSAEPQVTLMELSAHHIAGPALADLARTFPDAPPDSLASSLTLLSTIQRSKIDLAPRPLSPGSTGSQAVAVEMDRQLDRFMGLFGRVASALGSRGFWCDAVDPRTGQAVRGRAAERFSENAWVQRVLGYPVVDNGICPMLEHPMFGTACYPATIVTDAPSATLAEALDEAFGGASPEVRSWRGIAADPSPGASLPSASGFASPVLSIRGLSVRCPTGRLARLAVVDGASCTDGLSLDVWPGELVMMGGPNGIGKSTALKAIAGIYKRQGGAVTYTVKADEVFFLPQEPILGPGPSLRSQLEYGAAGAARWAEADMAQALASVGLGALLARCGGDLEAPLFGEQLAVPLSGGELQRLGLARLLLRRPKLAVLDEPLAAVSQDDLPELFALLRASGVGVLSVGHGTRVAAMHDVALRLG